MKLKVGMVVTVYLDDEKLQLLIVETGGGDKKRLNIEASLAKLFGGMAVGDTVREWKPTILSEPMRVELVKVEEADD